MFDDRKFDEIYAEIKLRNDKLEKQLMIEKLGIRARYQDAVRNQARPSDGQDVAGMGAGNALPY